MVTLNRPSQGQDTAKSGPGQPDLALTWHTLDPDKAQATVPTRIDAGIYIYTHINIGYSFATTSSSSSRGSGARAAAEAQASHDRRQECPVMSHSAVVMVASRAAESVEEVWARDVEARIEGAGGATLRRPAMDEEATDDEAMALTMEAGDMASAIDEEQSESSDCDQQSGSHSAFSPDRSL